MDAYRDVAHIWDFSNPLNFPQLPEDDFIAALQKQYPHSHSKSNSHDVVNPHSISNPTPSSEDSSPSPPVSEDLHDPAPKRKASDGGLEQGGPNQKAQHTLNSNKKGSNIPAASLPSRRKSIGSGPIVAKDETRLLKRKEQNRAAQRAFRERKEKHVKDLEDQVTALEEKNEQAMTENENLRDLLTRLQTENVVLKQQQASFTFSMPKNNATGGLDTQNQVASSFMDPSIFTPASAASSHTPTLISSPTTTDSSSKYSNPLDWSSLNSFDPSALNILDEPPQATATSGAMDLDFGFGASSDALPGFPYTTIASNPAFFSLASTFDSVTPSHQTSPSSTDPFNFDFNTLTSWPTNQSIQDPSLNDLFAASYMPPANTTDYNAFLSNTPELAPVTRRDDSSGSSSASSASSPPDQLQTPVSEGDTCPKSRGACQKAIKDSGLSPFAPPPQINLPAVLKKTIDTDLTPMISCSGSTIPKTHQSDDNVEVLTAWRAVTSHPNFKEADVNDLCAEFTAKAKCDGTKVVLDPQGVDHILKTISKI
ncbi:hypothetical protein M378DRAFT_66555 [Amanita muscaria Koide BX008]|uniref:BZIP domain-containing protein n=1 Tax=Amanita muscaria (strain Koide BX008) TaxID=946122 RepID=A0A0C2TUW2_AMAMK|nr:hypothetical protein M378DRAFT_66555 [Amanita muscaria Koide BX008]